ncbi:acyl-CoA-binding domain-containing protein 5 [Daktulosphaira vitifoliae]|uniref:acyl-CoA-binding domain-containing protein 5 n=1 Tax=Daktulosphaira vitifoliae TaxID=58002 RepID=UPI0021AAE850|nr:acyl-CoA-binding domain-containing protein 5 [Daktulosphaira vitifoliae]XP_050526910.1 acyl-CoA-binding domain-containing protein 5 [Daktulosphaira vitifoliae]XP_050526912.1 acyl-CoA-binding domain-containing protein 5 [Daktulosphaira vitifoliae]XP_050526913.1 acyl-CoA-binding domain-containing protein 5 [Daktulosphaira vitifoliae]
MSIEERFTAAVNVIRNLPKNGPYQPSNELMLRFYAYFKQATLGRNTQSKPHFWDVVNRAKWQAWCNLKDMSKEKAMELYVDELKKIVETMAYTDSVADFISSLDPSSDFCSIDDLKLVVGVTNDKNIISDKNILSLSKTSLHDTDTDIDDEYFHDVMESNENHEIEDQGKKYDSSLKQIENISNFNQNSTSLCQSNGITRTAQKFELIESDFQVQIRSTVANINNDLRDIALKVSQLESKLKTQNNIMTRTVNLFNNQILWQLILILGWPIVVQLLFIFLQKKNKHK